MIHTILYYGPRQIRDGVNWIGPPKVKVESYAHDAALVLASLLEMGGIWQITKEGESFVINRPEVT